MVSWSRTIDREGACGIAASVAASAGVSYNKFLAKLASDQRKPDGIFVITPAEGPDFVRDLPVGRFHGIGPATVARMARMGIHTGADLRAVDQADLIRSFGKAGVHFWRISRALDPRPVRADRERKSISAEVTFADDLRDPAEAETADKTPATKA